MATGITEKDVWRAADEVLQAGERPTIERIRTRLGRGSPNTVNGHLNTWYAQLSSRIRDLESFTPATSIPEPVGQAARHFWEVAQSVAREESATSMSEARAALLEDQQGLGNLKDELSNREKAFEARAAALEEALSLARDQLESAVSRMVALEASTTVLHDQLSDARTLELDLRSELVNSRNALDAERVQAEERRTLFDERLEQVSRRSTQEIDQAREQTKHANVELQLTRNELGMLRSEQSRTSEKLSETEGKLQKALRNVDEAQRAYRELTAQVDLQKESIADLGRALGESQRFLHVRDEEHGALLKQLVATLGPGAKSTRKKSTPARSI